MLLNEKKCFNIKMKRVKLWIPKIKALHNFSEP